MTAISVSIWVSMLAHSFASVLTNDAPVLHFELQQGGSHKERLAADDPLNHVKAFIDIQPVQSDISRGLEFLIEIVNESDETVMLTDPFDVTSVKLYSYEDGGRRLEESLPNVKPDFLISKRLQIEPPMRHDLMAKKNARRAFIQADSHALDASVKGLNHITNFKVTLEPGERFQMWLRLARCIADPKAYMDEKRTVIEQTDGSSRPGARRGRRFLDPTEIVPIRPGEYKLRVSLWLRNELDIPQGGITKVFLDPLITVHLGPE